jgi:proteasome lid subunit RPN8/RPN11
MGIVLKLKKSDYETMLVHCRQGLPNESCGLLAGTVEGEVKTVTKVYLLTNIDASNEHFSMDPREQLAALKDARANGFGIIGNFHSHPESPSRPSEEDKRLAYDSTIEYLILSLMEETPVLKAFGIDSDKNVTIHDIEYV